MYKILFSMSIFLGTPLAYACENYQLPDGYQDYFDSLDLPYKRPAGKFGKKNNGKCSITQDFNNDGKPDFAALYVYKGKKKRRDKGSMDLVIMYSENDSVKHIIYGYIGDFDKSKEIVHTYLEVLSPGIINTDPGEFVLHTPAIRLKNLENDNFTYYWDGEGFAELIIGD